MQPQYEKTLNIYLYLYRHANPDGTVPSTFRQLAQGLGYSSWSAVRWHILHLEEVGLIVRDNAPKSKPVMRIKDLTVNSPELAIKIISQAPRASWKKRKQMQEATA